MKTRSPSLLVLITLPDDSTLSVADAEDAKKMMTKADVMVLRNQFEVTTWSNDFMGFHPTISDKEVAKGLGLFVFNGFKAD